ncbi:malonyl-CoA decarboxylase [Bradyrhizobium cenepequi]
MKRFLSELLEAVTDRGRAFRHRRPSKARLDEGAPLALADLAGELLSVRGEASGVETARKLLDLYGGAIESQRQEFLQLLSDSFGPDRGRVEAAIERYGSQPEAIEELHAATEPRRQELLRRLNLAPGGTAALVRMREDVLRHVAKHPPLQVVDAAFLHLFSSWFNRGFLVLNRIDWTTPANILEKIIRYEAVHEIKGWDDLRRRLEPDDRRCFAFFHPQLADEPLIFVEVALTDCIPSSVDALLSEVRHVLPRERMNTAVFYSISNCQKGLERVTFGSFLIKQVVKELKVSNSSLTTFVTLSPIPGFRKWLSQIPDARSLIEQLEAAKTSATLQGGVQTSRLRAELRSFVARYLLSGKDARGRPLDPVARFHLSNGARLERINWLADGSSRGWVQSYGAMVNYRYELSEINMNHERYAQDDEVIASDEVRGLLTGPALAVA